MDFNCLNTTINLQTWVVILDFLGMGAKVHDLEDYTMLGQMSRSPSKMANLTVGPQGMNVLNFYTKCSPYFHGIREILGNPTGFATKPTVYLTQPYLDVCGRLLTRNHFMHPHMWYQVTQWYATKCIL